MTTLRQYSVGDHVRVVEVGFLNNRGLPPEEHARFCAESANLRVGAVSNPCGDDYQLLELEGCPYIVSNDGVLPA